MVWKRLTRVCVLVGVLLWLSGATAGETSSPVATYHHGQTRHEVSRAEFQSWLDFLKEKDTPQERLAQVQALVLVKVLAAEARQHGLDRQPRVQFLLTQAEQQLLYQPFYKHVVNQVSVSAEEVETAYAARPKNFHKPRRVQLYNLYKRVPPDATPAERQAIRTKLETLHQALVAGEDFRQLARRESDSQTRFEGGRLGLIQAGQLRPEIDAVAMQLKAGQISDIIETEDGFTILRCRMVLEAKTPSPAEVRQKLQATLLTAKQKQRWEAVQQELLKLAKPSPLLAPAELANATPETVVVRFASHSLTLAQLRLLLQQRAGKKLPHELPAARLQTLIDRYIIRVMTAKRARQAGLAKDAAFRNTLSWTRHRLLSRERLRQRVEERFVPLTQAEIRAYFETHKSDFQHKPAFDLAAIRLPPDGANMTEQYRGAYTLSQQLQSGQLDFSQAASRVSDLPSASKGGRLGWLSQPRVVNLGPRIFRAVTTLSPGAVSDVIDQDGRLWIVKMLAVRPQRPMTLKEAALRAENRLGNLRARSLQEKIQAELFDVLQIRLTS